MIAVQEPAIVRKTTCPIIKAKKKGWRPGQFRLKPKDNGYSVQEHVLRISGQTEWVEVSWANNKKAAERAMALRKRVHARMALQL